MSSITKQQETARKNLTDALNTELISVEVDKIFNDMNIRVDGPVLMSAVKFDESKEPSFDIDIEEPAAIPVAA